MAKEKPLSDRRSLFSQSNTSNYSNSVFSDFIRYSQTLTNRFVNPIKSGGSSAGVDSSSSPSPSPTPTPSPSPSPTPAPVPFTNRTPPEGGPYLVGDSAFGGIIGYILQPGDTGYDANTQKGIVVRSTPINEDFYYKWGCNGTLITGADGVDVGDGNQNTLDIMADCGGSLSNATPYDALSSAARVCSDLTFGGYSDWYLPSKGELLAIEPNKDAIGIFVAGDYYWSSTEKDATSAYYMTIGTNNSGLSDWNGKSSNLRVLPVRSF
jgi:hypothetical protein